MIQFIRQQGLKFQMVFWMSIISIISFMALFSFNFVYFRTRIISIQWLGVQTVAEIVAQSNMFDELDEFIDTGESNASIITLLNYKEDLIEKVMLNGICVYYQSGDEVYQVLTDTEYKTPLKEYADFPPNIVDACKNVFYTGQAEKQSVLVGDLTYYYYIQPVIINSKYKYGVCVYITSMLVELLLMRYVIVNVASFIIVLILLIILVIHAADKILIKPIVEMEKIVDSFVYQVSGGYVTFAFTSFHGNELMILRGSLERLKKLVNAHNKLMNESDQYNKWLKENINKLDAENSTLKFKLKSFQYELLCDKDILVGNQTAWKNKCMEINKCISNNTIDFLQLVYLSLDDSINKKEFIEGLMKPLGIDKGIPMETVFRISDTDFVFVFSSDGKLPIILEQTSNQPIKVGKAWLIKGQTKSLNELLEICKNEIKEMEK